MCVVMGEGGWKLISNLGVGYAGKWSGVVNNESVELFRIKKGGEISDLEEAKNLANKFPEIRNEMLAELTQFLRSSRVSMPYRNLASNQVSEQDRAASPKVLELGSEKDRVWVTLEQSTGKVGIQEAQLLYTLNPKEFDKTKGHREEWFVKEASIGEGIVRANMPPGATHAVFCLRDANGFLITSEQLPDFQTVPYGNSADSTFLKNGFAYKPGLFSLIQLGEDALASARKKSLNTQKLETSLSEARIQYQTDKFSVVTLSDAIRSLRGEIRKLKPIPQSSHYAIQRFPTEPLF